MTPLRSRTESWGHQLRGYSFLDEHNGGIFGGYMGSGKTKVGIDYVVSRELSPVLITAPPSVVNVWPAEFRRHAASNYQVLAFGADNGRKIPVEKRAREAAQFVRNMRSQRQPCAVVINDQAVWREPFARFALTGECGPIKTGGFQAVICDEAHRLKNHGGAFGKFAMEMAKYIPHRIGLTGTPMPHSEGDIFSQARFIAPEVFGTRWTPFKTEYAKTGGWQKNAAIGIRPEKRAEFIEKCGQVLFVVSKEELDLSLPEETHSQRFCVLPDELRGPYEELKNAYYTELADEIARGTITAKTAGVAMLRMQQYTSGHVRLDGSDGVTEYSPHKEQVLDDLFDDIQEPVVVFARFTNDLAVVERVAKRHGLRYGEVSGRRKDLTVNAEMPPDVDVLGVNVQSGSLGINLTRATLAVFFSIGYSLGDYWQCLSRLCRPGQRNAVRYLHLITQNTIDEMIYAALENKQDLVDAFIADILSQQQRVSCLAPPNMVQLAQ